MKTLFLFAMGLYFVSNETINFKSSQSDDWYVLNDGVMGGLSKGKTIDSENGIVFFGDVSLENNGGFTSYRGPWKDYELSNYETVTIRYRSEGIQLAFVMETSRRFWIPNYKVSLTQSDEFISTTFQLKDFRQYRLGTPTGKSLANENLDDIIRLGFITDEKRAGDFKFEVVSVEFN